jgi:threonine/homoserine/homoserine lactone efflux protein
MQLNSLLPSWPLLAAFLVASLVLAITPGPGVFYIVTRSVTQGRRAGLASVAGVAMGNLGNALGAALGLGALFAVSTIAFQIVKYVGAAYLIYLGVQALRAQSSIAAEPPMPSRVFREGFVVALFNPKTAIFFAAFLPQFMQTDAPLVQSVVLGSLFVGIAAITDSLYALCASAVAPWLKNARVQSKGKYFAGAVYIALGVAALFTSRQQHS